MVAIETIQLVVQLRLFESHFGSEFDLTEFLLFVAILGPIRYL